MGELTIVGNHISPFVRKVLATCEIKGLAYRIDSIVPFFGGDRFATLSPLRRIPVLIDGDVIVNDSSVICEYLEEKWPQPGILPADPATRARSRFLDEYADSRMSDVMLWKIFGRAAVAPAIFGVPRDIEAIQNTMVSEFPLVMDQLEAWAPASDFVCGAAVSVADLSVVGHFANLRWARASIDAARWPRTSAWVARVEAETPLGRLNAIGEKLLRVSPTGHRPVLQSLGIAISEETMGGETPVRGPMTAI
jgi:glutathione S-transferase